MSEMKDVRLLPCPFCSGIAHNAHKSGSAWFIDADHTDDCHFADFQRTEADAILAWNRRTALEPSPKPAGGEWVTVPREELETVHTVLHFDLARCREHLGDDFNQAVVDAGDRVTRMLSAAPPPPSADAQDVGELAWNCDKWPAWLHEIVDQTNVEADKWDMSTEQAIAFGVLTALTTYKRSATDGQS